MYYPRSWTKSILKLFIYLALIILLGIYLGNVTLVLLIATVSLNVFNYLHLYRLTTWIWESRKMSPPSAPGVWEHVYEGIYYLQRRNRNKRRNLGFLVKRFREGSEALPDAVVVVDKEAKIVWCNRHARIEMGLKWPDDSGRRIDNLIRHPKFIDYFHSGEYQYPIEIPAPTNPNKTFEYRIMAYGEDQLLLIVRDVSRVSQLEEMRKDFVANVSHELRTPLTVINGYLEVLSADTDEKNPFVNKAMAEMGTQTMRMQALIEDLLVLSRIEASAERIYENTIDMTAMLKQVETEAQTLNQEKQHNISFKVDDELRIFGVETEMRSACSNLIFNAIYYTPSGGNIKVIWKRRGSAAYFTVVDNGDGIEEKHLRRLTERFYRVDKARSRKTGGSGLGLSIVKHVLNHHNSYLNIESKIGKGSEFSFILPPELIYEHSLDS
jgi:two-component system phosphate regulon sensor histidine kinase PhoR